METTQTQDCGWLEKSIMNRWVQVGGDLWDVQQTRGCWSGAWYPVKHWEGNVTVLMGWFRVVERFIQSSRNNELEKLPLYFTMSCCPLLDWCLIWGMSLALVQSREPLRSAPERTRMDWNFSWISSKTIKGLPKLKDSLMKINFNEFNNSVKKGKH